MNEIKLTYLEKIIHEMNGQVNTIYVLSDILSQEGSLLSKINNHENLKLICDASQKLAKMIGLLSSITNLKSNKINIQLEELDLVNLVEKEVSYYSVRTKITPGLKIDFSSKILNCQVKIDEFWFKQLLGNLITNAVNHCDKGLIQVRTDIFTKNGVNYFRLYVCDEGCGISEHELETIFLPLERGSHSVGKVPGSGIGLAIAKEVAEAHGGSIVAKNNAKVGATFEVNIPLNK